MPAVSFCLLFGKVGASEAVHAASPAGEVATAAAARAAGTQLVVQWFPWESLCSIANWSDGDAASILTQVSLASLSNGSLPS